MRVPPSLEVFVRLVSLWLVVIIAAAGLVQPAVAIPVDAPSRLLPAWTQYQKAEAAWVMEGLRAPEAAVEQREPALVIVEDRPSPPRPIGERLPASEQSWRELFLLARRLTKYLRFPSIKLA